MSLPEQSFQRRDVTRLAAGTAAGVGMASILARGPAAAATGPRLALRRDGGSVVSAVDVPIGAVPGAARRTGWIRTPAMDTDRFALLGLTWRSGTGRVRVRVRRVGVGWTGWRDVAMLHDLPDRSTGEARVTPVATEPVWVGECDGIQVEVTGSADRPVLTLVDPGETDADRPRARPRRNKARVSGRPRIRSRRKWRAKARWTTGKPEQVPKIKQVHVHHTATSNDYRKRDVPRILRAIQRYHTQTLGWSDVGYNYFVDRFGRMWVGRRETGRGTVGAHTLGFNTTSVGIAVLGSYQDAVPTPQVLAAVAKIAAWKLKAAHRNPLGSVRVTSRGSDRHPSGERVSLPVIDGHRDTNDTECPGEHLYAALPEIRLRTRQRIRRLRRKQRRRRHR